MSMIEALYMLVIGIWVVWNRFAGRLRTCTLTTSFGDPVSEWSNEPRILSE